jgi:hypothetical protein
MERNVDVAFVAIKYLTQKNQENIAQMMKYKTQSP